MGAKTKKKLERKGYKTYRFKDNLEEEAFALAWEEQQKYGHLVDQLLSNGEYLSPPSVSDEARKVGNMVIQWLGSPVGQCFLRDMGYAKVGKEISQATRASDLMKAFKRQMKKDPDSILPRSPRRKK